MDISLLIYVDLNNNNELSVTLDYRDDQGNTILENPKDLVLPLKLDGVIQTLQKYLEYDEITQMYYLYNEEDIYDFITVFYLHLIMIVKFILVKKSNK